MATTAISKRYLDFYQLFEKKVTEIQQQVNRINALEDIYKSVVKAIEQDNIYKELCLVNINENQVSIQVDLNESLSYHRFLEFTKFIGSKLKEDDLHKNGDGASALSGIDYSHTWKLEKSFKMKNDPKFQPKVWLTATIPVTGMEDIYVKTSTKTYSYEYTEYTIIEKKSPIKKGIDESREINLIELDF